MNVTIHGFVPIWQWRAYNFFAGYEALCEQLFIYQADKYIPTAIDHNFRCFNWLRVCASQLLFSAYIHFFLLSPYYAVVVPLKMILFLRNLIFLCLIFRKKVVFRLFKFIASRTNQKVFGIPTKLNMTNMDRYFQTLCFYFESIILI